VVGSDQSQVQNACGSGNDAAGRVPVDGQFEASHGHLVREWSFFCARRGFGDPFTNINVEFDPPFLVQGNDLPGADGGESKLVFLVCKNLEGSTPQSFLLTK
jgi:hypothetical protein